MRKEHGVNGTAVQRGSGNVYADLGYPDAEGMLVKAELVAKIAEIIRQRGLSQEKAAKLLRLTQPKISRLLKGNFEASLSGGCCGASRGWAERSKLS